MVTCGVAAAACVGDGVAWAAMVPMGLIREMKKAPIARRERHAVLWQCCMCGVVIVLISFPCMLHRARCSIRIVLSVRLALRCLYGCPSYLVDSLARILSFGNIV